MKQNERIKRNRIVRYLLDSNKNCDLNLLWDMLGSGMFTIREMKEFYYLLGHSQQLIDEIEAFDGNKRT